MRKLLMFVLAFASFGFMGSWVETKANTVAKTNPQVQIEIGRHRRHYRDRDWRYRESFNGRTVVQTRLVREGWRTYRETYQVTYLPDGRTQTTLISRVRVDY